SFATPNNPLDVTGYVLLDRELMGNALRIVAADPGIDFVMMLQDLPRQTADPELALQLYSRNAETIRESATPIIPVGNVLTDINETGRMIQAGSNYPQVAGGIEHGLTALGHAVRWSEVVRRHRAGQQAPPQVDVVVPDGLPERRGSWAEQPAARFLAANGVPMVPSELASTADEAVAAAASMGYPVVVKAAVDGLEHKSDIGGVKLNLATADQV